MRGPQLLLLPTLALKTHSILREEGRGAGMMGTELCVSPALVQGKHMCQ